MPEAVPEYDPTVAVNLPVLALLLGLIALQAVTTFFNNRQEWRQGRRLAPLWRVFILGLVLLTLVIEQGNYVLASASYPLNEDMFQLKISFLQQYRIGHLFLMAFVFPFLALVQVITDLRSLLGKGSIGLLVAEIVALTGLVMGQYSSYGWMRIVSTHVN